MGFHTGHIFVIDAITVEYLVRPHVHLRSRGSWISFEDIVTVCLLRQFNLERGISSPALSFKDWYACTPFSFSFEQNGLDNLAIMLVCSQLGLLSQQTHFYSSNATVFSFLLLFCYRDPNELEECAMKQD